MKPMHTIEALEVTVNGDRMALPPGTTIAALLAHLSLDTRKVAVERNEAIVRRNAYANTALASEDSIEIVHFIGGG